MRRVIFYIDGFNFYYGLRTKKWRKYYWLDLVKFCEQFLKPYQQLEEVNYFTAIQKNKEKQDRQDLFLSANKLNPKFQLHLGKFLYNKKKFGGREYIVPEEKETDVRIATKMIGDVVQDKCEFSVLVSADSDLIPPIDLIRELKPLHKIFVYFPPARFSYSLKQIATKSIKLENHPLKFEKAVLPEEITLPNGYVLKHPEKWK